ncbi:hypothetical protein ABZ671_18990 [Micromonospora sp. NPDC006766]|uniref:hypothetical protein n=1 Tax=Micromonospora sp. NPDC006766 TaxID=3154778 RepID=UPI00340CA1CC
MRILTAVTERIARSTTSKAARKAYFDLDRHAYRIRVELTRPMSGITRAGFIGQLASLEAQQARLHLDAFGPDPIPGEDGRDMAESLRLSALLLDLIADTEYAVAVSGPRVLTTTELEPHAGPILNRMLNIPNPVKRGQLLDELYDAVVDVVGGQAAETIACLPAPGHEQLVTAGQHIGALVSDRSRDMAREIAWGVLVLVAAVLTAVVTGPARIPAWLGVAVTIAGTVAAGLAAWAPQLLRPNRMPAVSAALVAAAFGLVAGDANHDIGPNLLVVAVAVTIAAGGVLTWRLRSR